MSIFQGMSSFLNSRRLLKGAMSGVDPCNSLANVAVFQYNPGTNDAQVGNQRTGIEI